MTAVGHVLPSDLPALEAAVVAAPTCQIEAATVNVQCADVATVAAQLAHAGDQTETCDTRLYLLCDEHLRAYEEAADRAAQQRVQCTGCRARMHSRSDLIRQAAHL